MKQLLNTFFLFFLFIPLLAQNYSFDDGMVPYDWAASGGDKLSISFEHYKDDSYSLKWETQGNNALVVSFSDFTATSSSGAELQIYSPAVSNHVLKVDFITATNLTVKTANYRLNYKGWRDFTRKYTEYASTGTGQRIAKVRFTLIPSTAGQTTIYFDRVNFNATVTSGRVPGIQWVDDINYMVSGNDITPLSLFSLTKEIPVTAASAKEIEDINLLRTRVAPKPARPNTTVLNNAKTFADGLNIVRNPDGTVRGKMIDNTNAALTATAIADYAQNLEALAYDYLNNPSDNVIKERFNNFFDHLIEQGIAEGCSFSIRVTDYTTARKIPNQFLNVLPACTDAQKEELIKLVNWFSYYYVMYYAESDYLKYLNSDIIYLYLPYFTIGAIYYPDMDVAVRELKAVKRFLDRNTEYVPGGRDILKPDGTGFHHKTHYNNYMYAYQTWVDNMYTLRGTSFQISAESYQRLKKAILTVYRMATSGSLDSNRLFALSFAGRNPFASGQSLFFNQARFENLIDIGTAALGALDEELAGAYNYFYSSTKYAVPENKQEGFYQFNYSPAAIYRKNNWVVTMRAPTTNFWGAEIYDKQNRFGRYQSHGTLEVMYPGNLIRSGYPTNKTGGGWDWNMPQGGTTVKYSTWQDLMPSRNVTQRFDQYAKTKNFAGALAWGDKGIFVADFDQDDTWGAQRFTPTNLKFKKSMFAYNGMIVSLGSDISAQGSYNNSWNTLTTLFQNQYSSNFSNQVLVVNGESKTTVGYEASLPTSEDNWFITPSGTGYLVPKGNENINVSFAKQKTPIEDGSDYLNPTTEATVAKAFIDHGVKPTNKSYSFVVLPAATNAAMQNLTQNYSSLIRINQQSSALHSVTFLEDNTNAYTFFEPTSGLTCGRVKSSNGRMLLMEKEIAEANEIQFAASCPDLNPIYDNDFDWRSSTRSADIVLNGEWEPQKPVEGVSFSTPVNGETNINLKFNEGEPLYFSAIKLGSSVQGISAEKLFSYRIVGNNIVIEFKSESSANRLVEIYSIDGKMINRSIVSGSEKIISISDINTRNSILICKIKTSEYSHSFKIIK